MQPMEASKVRPFSLYDVREIAFSKNGFNYREIFSLAVDLVVNFFLYIFSLHHKMISAEAGSLKKIGKVIFTLVRSADEGVECKNEC